MKYCISDKSHKHDTWLKNLKKLILHVCALCSYLTGLSNEFEISPPLSHSWFEFCQMNRWSIVDALFKTEIRILVSLPSWM